MITFKFLLCLSFLIFALDFLVGSYMLPTTIATRRDNVSLCAIMLFNILLGWTIVVWLVVLVWAMCGSNAWAPEDEDEIDI